MLQLFAPQYTPLGMLNTTGLSYYIEIDVGSVRASLVSKSGKVRFHPRDQDLARSSRPSRFEQSTTVIWAGVGKDIKEYADHRAEEAGSSQNQK